jgi:hypothetical protein
MTMSRNPDISAGLDAACDAAIDALAASTADVADVRLMLIAAVGDPADRGQTQARLAAPDDTETSDTQKVAMILATLKAIAPELYETMMTGLDRARSAPSPQLRRRGH